MKHFLSIKDLKSYKNFQNYLQVRSTYQAVAEAYRPGMGRFVLCAQLTELLSTCIIYIVIAGDLLQSCIPSLGKKIITVLRHFHSTKLTKIITN